jgi:hypothetical protein
VPPRWSFLRWKSVKRSTSMLQKTGRTDKFSQGTSQLTCKLSWAGALRFRVFLAATFLTAFLAWIEARGATGPEDALLLGADFGEIGWLSIMTFFRGGELWQKRTTGAGGRNLKGEPSACMGSGPSCCCQEIEPGYRQLS